MASPTPAANGTHPEIKLPVLEREQLILNNRSYNWITERICGVLENRQPLLWWLLFIPSALIALIGVGGGLFHLVSTGVGVWGNTNRVMWGWPIVNFVFWIGIGHAGTLISAILFLTRQNWRTSINRAAEAMTIFAHRCPMPTPSGKTSSPRCSGTSSRFPPISPCR
jgi:molybdopterin-containing oxidoreductase family membrane subunit